MCVVIIVTHIVWATEATASLALCRQDLYAHSTDSGEGLDRAGDIFCIRTCYGKPFISRLNISNKKVSIKPIDLLIESIDFNHQF